MEKCATVKRAADRRLTVVFFVPDLSGGGAEKMCTEFLSLIDASRFRPILIVCNKEGSNLSAIPSTVPLYSLQKKSRFSLPLLIFRYSKLISRLKPDVTISFAWYCDMINLLAPSGQAKAVCSIHCVPREIQKERFGRLKCWISRKMYPRADKILTVSKAVKEEFSQTFLSPHASNITVQNNPFPLARISALSQAYTHTWPCHTGRLVAVGRLDWVKGFDVLLNALATLPTHQDWHLVLCGTGDERKKLTQLVQQLRLQNKVTFAGYQANPYPIIASADALICSSRFEAFPSVIVEALALATPVVSFDCPSGPAEILNGQNGILVPDGDRKALADAVLRILSDATLRNTLSQAGPLSVQHLDAPASLNRLEETLIGCIQKY
ncbi:MAG: glycosyltransferase [Gammaproteobacteria bacterium]|jgi:glycosyltransferase involved in cell wall biosynthesis